MSNVKFNPTEGENDKLVSVFSEINEGLDTTLNYTISDEGNKAKKSIVVNQVGKREKFLSKKGEEYRRKGRNLSLLFCLMVILSTFLKKVLQDRHPLGLRTSFLQKPRNQLATKAFSLLGIFTL